MRDREYSTYMLLNAPGFGIKSIFYIYERLKKFGLNVNDLFEVGQKQLSEFLPELGHGKFSRASLDSLHAIDDDKIYNNYQKLKHEQVYLIGLDDDRYPKSIIQGMGENAPPVLFCKGNLQLLNAQSVSIVGSREVSDFAVLLTKRIANRLANSGFNVTSGLAKGVDTNAHIGALEAGGTTTMVLSYGFNYLSVKSEIKKYNWERNTLFISQFMPYEKFSGQNAMTRNKLVCALSNAVIVISSGPERDSSGKMSGTFDAGLTALKYKIPLFILNPELLKPNPPQGNVDLIRLGGVSLSNGDELVKHLYKLTPTCNPYAVETKEQAISPSLPNLLSESLQEQYNTKPINIKDKILNTVNGKSLSVQEIITAAGIDWTPEEMRRYLKKLPELEFVKSGRINLYKQKSQGQTTLFPEHVDEQMRSAV